MHNSLTMSIMYVRANIWYLFTYEYMHGIFSSSCIHLYRCDCLYPPLPHCISEQRSLWTLWQQQQEADGSAVLEKKQALRRYPTRFLGAYRLMLHNSL